MEARLAQLSAMEGVHGRSLNEQQQKNWEFRMHGKVVCESTWRLRLGKTEQEQEEESAIFFFQHYFIYCLSISA